MTSSKIQGCERADHLQSTIASYNHPVPFVHDGTLYFTVRFTNRTSFCVRYACDMFAIGAELSDWQSGDFHIIREYMKPIPR